MRLLVVGASSGLGLSLAENLPQEGDLLYTVSRTEPKFSDLATGVSHSWIQADIKNPQWLDNFSILGETPVDVMVFCAGTWEGSSEMAEMSASEIYEVFSTNVAAFAALCCRLERNLAAGSNPSVIAIGSTAGFENATGKRVAYAGSKFGLRGVVHAARESWRELGIKVCCISPGGMASDVPASAGKQVALQKYSSTRIPLTDMVSIVRMVVGLSEATCVKEIVVPSQLDFGI